MRPLSNVQPSVNNVPPQVSEYRAALMAMPGVTSSGWGAREPDAMRINCSSSELAHLANAVLADTIDGMRIVITANGGMQELPKDSWVRNPTNVARMMAALPGVVDWQSIFGYTLFAENAERAAWLRKVVSPTIDGTPVRVMLRGDLP